MYHPFARKKKHITIKGIKHKLHVVFVLIFISPTLVASNANTPNNLAFVGYEEVSKNILYANITKNTTPKIGDLLDEILSINQFTFAQKQSTNTLNVSAIEKAIQSQVAINKKLPLDNLIPKPTSPQLSSFLKYPDYNINTPLVYSKLQDFFVADSSGNLIRDSNNELVPIVENKEEVAKGNYESVPVQKLLKNGVVHTAFTVDPGEIGNSYIVGHSSNFSSVQSPYNYIFKPIEKRSKVGEEFIIYDKDGRELRFKVFEVMEIQADDVQTAYKNFGDKRVVTLQTSVLDANFQPTKRWLTRGELVL